MKAAPLCYDSSILVKNYDPDDIGAPIATGLAENLLCGAADVMLKEPKNLVLAVRETPLNSLHLKNMLKMVRLGAGITPLYLRFYHHPAALQALITMMTGRVRDAMGVDNTLCKR